MLKIENLSKSYGKKQVLKNINLDIDSGEIIGIVGPNGAGKTTLLKCISSIAINYEGTISINEVSSYGLVLDELKSYSNRTLKFNLEYFKLIRGLESYQHSLDILSALNLEPTEKLLNTTLSKFSYGMKQKVTVALSLMSSPDFIMLDEPFRGLDESTIDNFKKLLFNFKEDNKTVLFSSHNLSDVENICDKVIVIKNGVILDIIDAKVIGDSTSISFSTNNNEMAMQLISSYNPVIENNLINLELKQSEWKEILKTLLDNDIEVLKVSNNQTLKDRVFKLMGGAK